MTIGCIMVVVVWCGCGVVVWLGGSVGVVWLGGVVVLLNKTLVVCC